MPMLASRLKRDGLDTFVSGVDMNNLDAAVGGLGQLNPAALSALGRLNTHDHFIILACLSLFSSEVSMLADTERFVQASSQET